MTALTSRLAASGNPAEIRRALALQPDNPELHHRLGLAYLYNLQDGNSAAGLDQLRQAAHLAPDRALYWSDLASACRIASDLGCADAATQRALLLQPMMPRLHWEAAGYDFSAHQIDAAEKQLRQLLGLRATYAEPTFSLCLSNGLDPQTIMDTIMPAGRPPGLTLEFANYLAAHGRFDSAARVWKETLAGDASFSFSLAEPYLNSLLRAQRYEQAWSAWKDLESRSLLKSANGSDLGNIVFNGSFENVPLNTGFDWIVGQEPFVSVDFLSSKGYQGAHCLRLAFAADRNRDYEPLFQIVPVTPGRNYRLKAYVRSAGITSSSGPRLRVIDPLDPKRLSVSSNTTVGTTPWHPIQLTFSTASETHFVELSVWRPQGRAFPAGISGTFWVDEVSLEPSGTPSE